MLEEAAQRLHEDAQIQDLYAIYWKIRNQPAAASAAPAHTDLAASNENAMAGRDLHVQVQSQ